MIKQGSYLYGVRFGAETSYCLLDIDIGSLYHPRQDSLAISRLVAALEPLGLFSYIACTSSSSGGLHLYFPFHQAQSSWQLAIAVTTLIENAGFKLKPGQLEVFPDPKPYSVDGKPSLFNAHRLPLQIGSYLVDQDFQPIWGTQQTFVQQWQFARERNDVEASVLRSVLKQVRRRRYSVSTKAEKFINDLNAEIEVGWTSFGQTNHLLGRITMREYIFHHVLAGGDPLVGSALVDVVVEIARSLPGYSEYCRHRHEIQHRAEEWASCIENSRYFHYGDASGKFKSKQDKSKSEHPELEVAIDQAPTWNQQQSEQARDRIRKAMADLLEKQSLPKGATARFRALLKYGIGGQTLYRHRDLWHPAQLVENPPYPPASYMDGEVDCHGKASTSQHPTSLFLSNGSNCAASLGFNDLTPQVAIPLGSNSLSPQSDESVRSEEHKGVQFVQQVLSDIQTQRTAQKASTQLPRQQHQQAKRESSEARYQARMQQFLDSGDPILIAEAIASGFTAEL